MRLSFASGILCAGLFAVSCVQRDYNKAETKSVSDTKAIVKNPDGTFTVTCDWGAVENNVTAEQINKNDVCKGTQVNPMAFNAFDIWRDEKGVEILDYPLGYDALEGAATPDGVFYVDRESYWDKKFTGVPTKGAKVVDGVLEYPLKNGKQLKLKFAKATRLYMSHMEAVQYCKNNGKRLPTVREIFDFCAAGVTEPNYGPDFKVDRYPSTARCYEDGGGWTTSVYSADREDIWLFHFRGGTLYRYVRDGLAYVRCVGPAE
jgi:hypothetical protein